MISEQTIEEVKNRLVQVYKPEAIYIFGSYAWGSPSEDSDLDLVVVVKEIIGDRMKQMSEGHRVLWGLDLSKDILLYSEEEFKRYSQDRTRLCYKVKQDGKQIYAKA